MHIGHIPLANRLFVAPMAGVTDRPFRQLCKALGAGYAVSEMVTSRKDLWNSLKTSRRANHEGEPGPIAVQIAGTDAPMMAEAAVYNVERGAQIIDINMGCPAKKVCNKWAGSALMQNEVLAVEIAAAVVEACAPFNVPVTLKMRTGWCQAHKNAPLLARAAEGAGIAMLTVHGRTRADGYSGEADRGRGAGLGARLLRHLEDLARARGHAVEFTIDAIQAGREDVVAEVRGNRDGECRGGVADVTLHFSQPSTATSPPGKPRKCLPALLAAVTAAGSPACKAACFTCNPARMAACSAAHSAA